MRNLKENIIIEYENEGVPIYLSAFCDRYKKELSEVNMEISEMPVLDNLFNLSPEQAYELIKFYGKGFLFTPEIESNVYSYIDTRKTIDEIERKRGSSDP